MKRIVAFGLAVVAGHLVPAAGTSAAAATIEVVRGDSAETMTLPATGTLAVLKGTGAEADDGEESGRRWVHPEARWTVVGGTRVWLVDAESNEVIVCRWHYSATVGDDGIVCAEGAIFADFD